jgi:hypothetical protein
MVPKNPSQLIYVQDNNVCPLIAREVEVVYVLHFWLQSVCVCVCVFQFCGVGQVIIIIRIFSQI